MPSPPTLTSLETTQLLAELLQDTRHKYTPAHRQRDHALALFMLHAGLRVGELVQLSLSDLLFAGQPVRTLIIRPEIAKRNHQRHIPLSERLQHEIADLNSSVWAWHNHRAATFAFYRSDPTTHLTTRSVENIITTAALKAIGRPVHPHVLRHTFASNMMRVTNARIVQELLGHADLRSTQIYTHPNGDDLEDAIAARDKQERTTTP